MFVYINIVKSSGGSDDRSQPIWDIKQTDSSNVHYDTATTAKSTYVASTPPKPKSKGEKVHNVHNKSSEEAKGFPTLKDSTVYTSPKFKMPSS